MRGEETEWAVSDGVHRVSLCFSVACTLCKGKEWELEDVLVAPREKHDHTYPPLGLDLLPVDIVRRKVHGRRLPRHHILHQIVLHKAEDWPSPYANLDPSINSAGKIAYDGRMGRRRSTAWNEALSRSQVLMLKLSRNICRELMLVRGGWGCFGPPAPLREVESGLGGMSSVFIFLASYEAMVG